MAAGYLLCLWDYRYFFLSDSASKCSLKYNASKRKLETRSWRYKFSQLRALVGVFFKYVVLLIQMFMFSSVGHFSFCIEITACFLEVPSVDYRTSMN